MGNSKIISPEPQITPEPRAASTPPKSNKWLKIGLLEVTDLIVYE